jgi:CRP-like cAMP-binding protein
LSDFFRKQNAAEKSKPHFLALYIAKGFHLFGENHSTRFVETYPLQQLLQHIQQYATLSPNALAALQQGFEEQVYAKGDHLLREGQVCRHLYFMQSGAIRGYYLADGKEVTHWFGFEHDFITSFHSYTTAQPAVENLQFLEGSLVWRISKMELQNLFDAHHDIERLVRIAYEKYYIRLEERFVNAQFTTPRDRYLQLVAQSPHMLQRVPLQMIASYLGTTPETISRIRSKL